MKQRPQPSVTWSQEGKTLTLEGEPVLEYALRLPVPEGGRGCRRVGRYYTRVGQIWRRRWERELYWLACLDLVACRERSRPFRTWSARLDGEVTLLSPEHLSVRMEARECGSDGLPTRVTTGDVWRLPQGVPLPLGEVLPRARRKQLVEHLTQEGTARRAAGELFLDGDFAQKLPRVLSPERFCLREGGLEFYFPQCTVAPAAEGCPALLLRAETQEEN